MDRIKAEFAEFMPYNPIAFARRLIITINMPSHKQLSNWYAQLGQHLEAGTLLPDALRLCEGLPEKGRFVMADELDRGTTFNRMIADAPRWLPNADRQFMVAGMETGSLPQTLHNLSARHASVGATQLKIILGLTYPIGVFHIAAMLLPVIRMIDYEKGVDWDFQKWMLGSALLIAPVWLIIGLIVFLSRTHSPLLPRILRFFPILRAYSRAQALADLAYGLGTFIAAGVPVPSAWRLSVKLVDDKRFEKVCASLEPVFAAGEDPARELKKYPCFPADFTSFYRTGADSGKLDSNLLIAGKQYQDRANNAMTLATLVYPSLVFAIVAGIIIWTIFSVFGGYLDMINSFSS